MSPEIIDWGSGEVLLWDLWFLDQSQPLLEQVDCLKEDLAQVAYENEVLLDIGWYPEFSDAGGFVIRVVKQINWDEPLFIDSNKTVDGFLSALKEAILIAKNAV